MKLIFFGLNVCKTVVYFVFCLNVTEILGTSLVFVLRRCTDNTLPPARLVGHCHVPAAAQTRLPLSGRQKLLPTDHLSPSLSPSAAAASILGNTYTHMRSVPLEVLLEYKI